MDNLYSVYLLKRHYLMPLNSLNIDSDLDDYRVYTVVDYTIASLENENFKILEGLYEGDLVILSDYYYDEEYLVLIDKKITNQRDLESERNKRSKNLYNFLGKYYMKIDKLFFIVKDLEAIATINSILLKQVKKSSDKVISLTECYKRF